MNKNVKIFLLSDTLYYGGYDLLTAFLSVLITTQISPNRLDILGIVISFQMIVRVIVEYPLSKITHTLSAVAKKNIVAIANVLYGSSILLLGFSTKLEHVFILLTIMSVTEALAYPIKWALFSKIQDKRNEELEWSLEDVTTTLGAALFSLAGGYLANSYGLPVIFIIFAMLFILSGLVFFFIKKN